MNPSGSNQPLQFIANIVFDDVPLVGFIEHDPLFGSWFISKIVDDLPTETPFIFDIVFKVNSIFHLYIVGLLLNKSLNSVTSDVRIPLY